MSSDINRSSVGPWPTSGAAVLSMRILPATGRAVRSASVIALGAPATLVAPAPASSAAPRPST